MTPDHREAGAPLASHSWWREYQVEALEGRLLLSYTAQVLNGFGVNSGGAQPKTGVVMDSAGDLFGTTSIGGAFGKGTVYELARGSDTVTSLVDFDGANGWVPNPIVVDPAGNLFGTTQRGGSHDLGTVFEIPHSTGTLITLASFDGTNGIHPFGNVVVDSGGNLYGTTWISAANNGTVFEIPASTGTLTTLVSFADPNGQGPNSLAMTPAGDLYGTTIAGGAFSQGTVFELPGARGPIKTVVSFDQGIGENPISLLSDSGGNLYGVTEHGGLPATGTIFEIVSGTSNVVTLAPLASSGGTPGGVVVDSAGNVFATDFSGEVFEVPRGSHYFTILASLPGSEPMGRVLLDGDGNLFGTTTVGGDNSEGMVFEVVNGSGAATILASFRGTNGQHPTDVIPDAAGNLWGTTGSGGEHGQGMLFTIAARTNEMTTVVSFDGADGASPVSGHGLVFDATGDLFGITQAGGSHDDGTVFEIPHGATGLTTIASFSGTDGAAPTTLIVDAAGNLFGTTWTGGASDSGTVFKIAHGSGVITTLASFSGPGLPDPNCLLVDGAGNLFGTTLEGGAYNYGSVFKIPKATGTLVTLTSFNYTTVNGYGFHPTALVLDAAGNLYGTLANGASNGEGLVFKISSGTSTPTAVAGFSGNGYTPTTLQIDRNGNLFGTTANGTGGIFEVTTGSNAAVRIFELDGGGAQGLSPQSIWLDASGNFFLANYDDGPNSVGSVLEVSPVATSILLRQSTDHVHVSWTVGTVTGQILINDPAGLTLTGDGALDTITLNYAAGDPLTAVLHLSGSFVIKGLQGQNPLAGHSLDLGRGTVYVSYTAGNSPLTMIRSALSNGYHGGTWTGSATATAGAIGSFAAAADPARATAIGYADSGNGTSIVSLPPGLTAAVELRLTTNGDANLDGRTDFSDLLTLAQNYSASTATWAIGDFNYDASVSFSDLLLLAQNYGHVLPAPAAAAASADSASWLLKKRKF